MTTFVCKSRTGSGKIVQKTIEADSKHDALNQLQASGLFPVTISASNKRAADEEGSRHARRPRKKKIKNKDLLNFTIQLRSLLCAGVPILSGVSSIADQIESESFREVLLEMYADIEGGESISAAMEKHPKVFSTVYVNTVAAGEQSGTLEHLLDNLGSFLESDEEVRSNVKSALLYPSIVICTLGLAVTVLMIFVVPRFATLYAGFNSELPLPTRILIGTSTTMADNLPLVIVTFGALIYGLRTFIRTPRGKSLLDHLLLRVPVLNKVIETSTTLRVTRMLGLFSRAGLPMLDALDTIVRTISNTRYKAELSAVADFVAGGDTLSGSMHKVGCFTPSLRQMIATGEMSGSLEACCGMLAGQYEKELHYLTKNLSMLIEPILTLGLAVIVLFVALATFLPMWDMAKNFQ